MVQDLYAAVSGPAGSRPDRDRLTELLHPSARMCRTESRGDAPPFFRIMDAQTWLENVEALVTNRGFFEFELVHSAEVYGNVAHVISHYEGWRDAQKSERLKRGMNSMQFLRVDGQWRVFSIVWDDEQNALLEEGDSDSAGPA